jgi:hypothetical protein
VANSKAKSAIARSASGDATLIGVVIDPERYDAQIRALRG